jgi:hypothetical protein
MKTNLGQKYEGMGFVEALIAIMVVGASSVVLMQIAANTLQDMIQNETIDTMTQYAVEGATMAQNVAMREKLTGEDVFPNPIGNTNNCYIIDKDSNDQYAIRKDAQGFITYTYDPISRGAYKDEAIVPDDPDNLYFRIFCVESYDTADQYAIVKIIVGQSTVNQTIVDGESITKGYSVKDYTYFTVVNL